RALIFVGPSDHPPGTHEPMQTAQLLASLLTQRGMDVGICTDSTRPSDLGPAATIVFAGDGFPIHDGPHRTPHSDYLLHLLNQGTGIACVHFAMGVQRSENSSSDYHPLLRFLGGYFAVHCVQHASGNVFSKLLVVPDVNSPLAHGWEPFVIEDELYYDL